MNVPALRTEILALLTSTANLTATEKQKLRNRAVTEYPQAWATYLVGKTDTAATRGEFVVFLTVNKFWGDIYRDGSSRENTAVVPAPETIE